MKPLMVAALLSAFSTVALAKTGSSDYRTFLRTWFRSKQCKKAPVRSALCVNENILSRRNRQ
jgi:hypothetical protein